MEDNSFLRFMGKPDGELLNPSVLPIRVLWFEQRHRYYEYLNNPTTENLEKVFGIFGKPDNIESLRLDQGAEVPFAGDMFFKTTFGRNVSIGTEALFLSHAGVHLGDGAIVGQKARLVTLGHPTHPSQRHLHKIGPIRLDTGAMLSANAIIINGGRADPVVIGEGSIVLPYAIISKNVPPYSLVTGTNEILLQGKQFFRPLDPMKTHEQLSLKSRLTPEGLDKLASAREILCGLDDLLSKTTDATYTAKTNIYKETGIALTSLKSDFFSATPPAILASCLIPSPVYVTGTIPVLKERMTVNQGCRFTIDEGSSIEFSETVLLAPWVDLKAKNKGTIHFEPSVWVGVGCRIIADAKKITIGQGSVIASGALITGDVPPWSIVTNGGKVLKAMTEADIIPLPPMWRDWDAYAKAFADNTKTARDMPSPERMELLQKALQATQPLNG
ncbi:MAG: hypothetical protein WC612_02750 [Bdellovibrionales bacterium]|jgi:acetyltransferase-like isoleucine patch superfamily enzyme